MLEVMQAPARNTVLQSQLNIEQLNKISEAKTADEVKGVQEAAKSAVAETDV